MTRLVIHVDRLVLHGVDPGDAAVVAAAVQAELQRALAAPHLAQALAASGNRYRLRAGDVRVDRRRGGAAMGRAVAGSIARGVES
jgi:hypothetical protein